MFIYVYILNRYCLETLCDTIMRAMIKTFNQRNISLHDTNTTIGVFAAVIIHLRWLQHFFFIFFTHKSTGVVLRLTGWFNGGARGWGDMVGERPW